MDQPTGWTIRPAPCPGRLRWDEGITPSAAAAVLAAISELVGLVSHELAGHFVGMVDPADALFDAVVDRQLRELGLDPGR